MTEEEFVVQCKAWQSRALRFYLRKQRRLMVWIRRGDTIPFASMSGLKYIPVFQELMRRHGYVSNPPYLRYEKR